MTEPMSPDERGEVVEPVEREARAVDSLVVRVGPGVGTGSGNPGAGEGSGSKSTPVKSQVVVDPFGLRFLVIGWSLWLLVSWSLTLAIGSPVHAVRWVVFSAVFGLMAVWPAVRLSQQLLWPTWRGRGLGGSGALGVASGPVRVWSTFSDWVSLIAVWQVVVWPLMFVGRWSVEQTLWLDIAVVSWSGLAAVLVGLGRLAPADWARVVAMLLCVLLLIGEPVWWAVSGDGPGERGTQMRVSPIQALWELTTTVQPYSPAGWRPVVLSAALAAMIGWVCLFAAGLWSRAKE